MIRILIRNVTWSGDMDAKRTKPFPWVCPDCRQKTVTPVQRDYSLPAVRDGESYEVTLHQVLIPTCSRCGGAIITSDLSQRIDAELQRLVEVRSREEKEALIARYSSPEFTQQLLEHMRKAVAKAILEDSQTPPAPDIEGRGKGNAGDAESFPDGKR